MKKTVAIVGGGAAALVLAAMLDENRFETTIYERQAAVGRKFLVAGDGGFNLTHSEPMDEFIKRYSYDHFQGHFLEKCLLHFTNMDNQNWLKKIGIETYIGTSKRIFPEKGIKPIQVLNAILTVLKNKNVGIKIKHKWCGWLNDDELIFDNNGNQISIKADYTIFALGGSSWPKTGSDGSWTSFFTEKNINIIPFQPSNCAYQVHWSDIFLAQTEGVSLKNIEMTCDKFSKKGEVVITRLGLEGGAIYALSPAIRKQLNSQQNQATVYLDLKPTLSLDDIGKKLSAKGNITKQLKTQLNLSDAAIALLKSQLTKEAFTNIEQLSQSIKKLPLSIKGFAPIDEAISTVGGIDLNELEPDFQFKKYPNYYAIGEMLDWDAPTGGYLLQACFSMGFYLADKLNGKM